MAGKLPATFGLLYEKAVIIAGKKSQEIRQAALPAWPGTNKARVQNPVLI
jgi:hypothetical protein